MDVCYGNRNRDNDMQNDLISRQAAINVADMADYTGLSVEDVKKVTDEVVKGLKALPSAQPESDWTEILVICDSFLVSLLQLQLKAQ